MFNTFAWVESEGWDRRYGIVIAETYTDETLEKELKKLSTPSFEQKIKNDANATSKLIGNTYAASVFMRIAALIDQLGMMMKVS